MNNELVLIGIAILFVMAKLITFNQYCLFTGGVIALQILLKLGGSK